MQGADDRRDEANVTFVTERSREDMEVSAERTSDSTRALADVVVQESHMRQPVRASYSAQLLSEIGSFDGLLQCNRLGELSAMDQQHFFRLNGVPDHPCSASFNLTDNSVESRELMEQIVSMGIQRNHVNYNQRFPMEQVDITFLRKEDRDLFLSKAAVTINQRRISTRPATESRVFVMLYNAPRELGDEIITRRLLPFGQIHYFRLAYNQSLLPERVHDGCHVYQMTLTCDIPCFLKFGPFLVKVYYPNQPKACWKCASPEHIGRECPKHFCFNCHDTGHEAPECPHRIKCSLCWSEQHLAVHCAGNWGRCPSPQRSPHRAEEPAFSDVTSQAPLEDTSIHSEMASYDGSQTTMEDSPDSHSEQDFHTERLTDVSQDEDEEFALSGNSEVIDQFTSTGQTPDPHPPYRKRGGTGGKPPNVKKKSKTEENPPSFNFQSCYFKCPGPQL